MCSACAGVVCSLIEEMLQKVLREEHREQHPPRCILAAQQLVFHLSTMQCPPAFITTFLQEEMVGMKYLEQWQLAWPQT